VVYSATDKTNKMNKKIKELSECHPLADLFIMESISRHAREVIENKEEIIKDNERSIVCPKAWVDCAMVLTRLTK